MSDLDTKNVSNMGLTYKLRKAMQIHKSILMQLMFRCPGSINKSLKLWTVYRSYDGYAVKNRV